MDRLIRSHLKIRVLVQVQGGPEFQPADILKYFEELKQGTNTEIGPKNYFEIASKHILVTGSHRAGTTWVIGLTQNVEHFFFFRENSG